MLRSIVILNIAENHNQKYFLATTFTQLYLASDMPQILSIQVLWYCAAGGISKNIRKTIT